MPRTLRSDQEADTPQALRRMVERKILSARTLPSRDPAKKRILEQMALFRETANTLIQHAFDPDYEPPTVLDLSRLPPEQKRVTEQDLKELDRLPEATRTRILSLIA